jgi:para-nitrobenzyl esterase
VLFGAMPSVRPMPNLPQLQALDSYYAWRRSQSPHHH